MNVIPYLLVIATGILSGSVFLGRHSVLMVIVAATASLSTAQTYAILFISMKQYKAAAIVAVLMLLSNLLAGVVQMSKPWNCKNSEDSQ